MNYASQIIKSFPILLGLSCFIIFLELIAPNVFTKYVEVYDTRKIASIIFLVAYSLICSFALPLTTHKYVYKNTLREMGLGLPENKTKAVFLTLSALTILLPWIFYFARLKSFQIGYSLGQPSFSKFAFIQVFLLPLYYFAEEFFFRGFLFLGLWRKIKWHSFWVTDIMFTYAHIGKPWLEFALAIPASVVFNYITLKSNSIYPAFIVHSTLGFVLNILITFNLLA